MRDFFLRCPNVEEKLKTDRHFVLLEREYFLRDRGSQSDCAKKNIHSQNFWFVVDLFKILICTKWFVCTFKNRFNSYNPGQNYVLGTSGIWRCVLTLLARIVDKFRYYLIYFLSQFWLAVKPLRQLQITSHSGEWRLSPEFSRKGKSVCTQATNNRL